MTISVASTTAVESAEARSARARLRPVDWLTLAYLIVSMSVLGVRLLGWPDTILTRWEAGWLLAAHGLLLGLVFLAPTARERARERGRHCFLAEWYPALVMSGLYTAVGVLNHPSGGATGAYDHIAQGWEIALFGRQVAYEWSRAMPWPALSWVLSLCYLAFYPLVLAAPAGLWFSGRRAAAHQAIFGISLSFFFCYFVFLVFPVAGPPYLWQWPDHAAAAVWPARMVQNVIDAGDSWGSAFPSSHVAASMTAAWLAFRGWRALGWFLLPLAVGIAFAVVYCQVHYAVDALAGLAVAVAACWIAARFLPSTATDARR